MKPEDAERIARDAKARAEIDGGDGTKAPLLVEYGDLPGTAERVRDVLAKRPMLFDRGIPVRLSMRGAAISGAGTGKGLFARMICAVAFGRAPAAMTAGHDKEELDKRLTAAFLNAEPVVFLDNVNGAALRSDVLASVITERPAYVRPLGKSVTVPLNSAALVVVTGNALTTSEDLARRFIVVTFDAHVEDPEARVFTSDPVADAMRDRATALADVLAIWRWGRQQGAALKRGRTLGSFEAWGRWCRDPLLALGCRDPVERVSAAKADDPQRRVVAEIFTAWWEHHKDTAMKAAELTELVARLLDPHERGRQARVTRCLQLAGTRCAGFVLTRVEAAGKWGAATYRLQRIEAAGEQVHRDHRDHQGVNGHAHTPMPPMVPMRSDPAASDLPVNGLPI